MTAKYDNIQNTYLFHDYETFGADPVLDRPAQFAAIRTDQDLNIIGEPEVFYCQPTDDYLPQPEAVMITGITPQIAKARGTNEAEFAAKITKLFCQPSTCVIGYNNIRFDDEVTRHLLYRNFYDPYGWSWQNGNTRWDMLDIMRACYALRPEGIEWPENEQGFPSFKLEHLTRANHIEHDHAHDAMSDVYATIAVTRLVKQQQPKLFDFLYTHRRKQKIMSLIDLPEMKPLVHISGMFGAHRGCTSWIAPLAWHPDNQNALISCDLAGDMQPLIELDTDTLRERLYTPRQQLEDLPPVPLKLVHINKCPVLAPAGTLRPQDAERLGIDRQHCLKNLALLKQHPEIREKVVTLFAEAKPFAPSQNVDAQLYDGFFGEADKSAMNIIRQTDPRNLPALDLTFSDPRIAELLFRYRARNFPSTLDETEQYRWLQHRRDVFTPQYLEEYLQRLDQLAMLHEGDHSRLSLLKALFHHAQALTS